MYKLKTPIKIFGVTYNYLYWYMKCYPISSEAYWQLLEAEDKIISNQSGTIIIPEDVLNNWGTDNSVIPIWIESKLLN